MIPEQVLERARKNLMLMSRTAHGIVDISSSEKKAEVMLVRSGEEAAQKARGNFEEAMNYAWEQSRSFPKSPEEVRRIIETIARTINRGIVKEESLIRREDSDKHNYLPVAQMEEELRWFYRSLYERLAAKEPDLVEAAAFTEFEINVWCHFFADGCGKTSLVSAAWVLLLGNHPLPEYRGGTKAIHAYEPPFRKGTRPEEEERAALERFVEFYRGLFD